MRDFPFNNINIRELKSLSDDLIALATQSRIDGKPEYVAIEIENLAAKLSYYGDELTKDFQRIKKLIKSSQ